MGSAAIITARVVKRCLRGRSWKFILRSLLVIFTSIEEEVAKEHLSALVLSSSWCDKYMTGLSLLYCLASYVVSKLECPVSHGNYQDEVPRIALSLVKRRTGDSRRDLEWTTRPGRCRTTTRTERLNEVPYRVLLVHLLLPGFNTPPGMLSVQPDF